VVVGLVRNLGEGGLTTHALRSRSFLCIAGGTMIASTAAEILNRLGDQAGPYRKHNNIGIHAHIPIAHGRRGESHHQGGR
jgi:hypothetical protein